MYTDISWIIEGWAGTSDDDILMVSRLSPEAIKIYQRNKSSYVLYPFFSFSPYYSGLEGERERYLENFKTIRLLFATIRKYCKILNIDESTWNRTIHFANKRQADALGRSAVVAAASNIAKSYRNGSRRSWPLPFPLPLLLLHSWNPSVSHRFPLRPLILLHLLSAYNAAVVVDNRHTVDGNTTPSSGCTLTFIASWLMGVIYFGTGSNDKVNGNDVVYVYVRDAAYFAVEFNNLFGMIKLVFEKRLKDHIELRTESQGHS